MNTINPQSASSGVRRSETQGGERTEAKSKPNLQSGNSLPKAEAKAEAKEVSDMQDAISTDVPGDQLFDAVAKLNDYIQTVQRDLRFTLDEGSGQSIISVIDRGSSEVIRQIPAEVTLTLAQKLNNGEPLYLFSAQV